MLENFKIYHITTGVPSMTCTKNGVGISKAAVARLGNAQFVQVLFDYSGRKMAIHACTSGDEGATRFSTGTEPEGMRWNNKDLIATLERITEYDFRGTKGYKFDGEIDEENSVLIFDLQKGQPL